MTNVAPRQPYLRTAPGHYSPFSQLRPALSARAVRLVAGRGGTRVAAVEGGRFDGKCVYLPVRSYSLVKGGRVVGRVVNSMRKVDCVAFRPVVVGPLVVRLVWWGGDDMDLQIREPGGERIYYAKPTSESGAVLDDTAGGGDCVGGNGGIEIASWDGVPIRGEYRVEIRHFLGCGGGAKWKVEVSGAGVSKVINGRAKGNGDNQIVGELRFRI